MSVALPGYTRDCTNYHKGSRDYLSFVAKDVSLKRRCFAGWLVGLFIQ